MPESLISTGFFEWVVLPLLIFLARICDVSLGTIRVIFISKGVKYLAPLIGFFEVIIWLLAIGQVMNNLTNIASYIAYGGGFAIGTFAGMIIEEKLSLGFASIRIVSREDPGDLVAALRSRDYGVTCIRGEGSTGSVTMVYSIVRREDIPKVVAAIHEFSAGAFYVIEEIRSASEGVFPAKKGRFPAPLNNTLKYLKKG